MKGKKIYYLSGGAVLFVLGLLTLVLMSGRAEKSVTAAVSGVGLNRANPLSIAKSEGSSHWSDELRQGNININAGDIARPQEAAPGAEQKVTHPTYNPEDFEIIAYAKKRAKAEEEGRLDEFLKKEEAWQEKRELAKARTETRKEHFFKRNEYEKQMVEYEKRKKEWKRLAREAREQGLELPPEPVEPPRPEKPEMLGNSSGGQRDARRAE